MFKILVTLLTGSRTLSRLPVVQELALSPQNAAYAFADLRAMAHSANVGRCFDGKHILLFFRLL